MVRALSFQSSPAISPFLRNILTLLLFVDVKDIKFVINYNFPNNIEDYVHRIGRTGRANTYGTAITFFTPDNAKLARPLIRILEEAKQEVEPKLREFASYGGGGSSGGRGGRGGFNRWGSSSSMRGSKW